MVKVVKLKCPKCDNYFIETITDSIYNIEYYHCFKCGKVWFNEEEKKYEKIVSKVSVKKQINKTIRSNASIRKNNKRQG